MGKKSHSKGDHTHFCCCYKQLMIRQRDEFRWSIPCLNRPLPSLWDSRIHQQDTANARPQKLPRKLETLTWPQHSPDPWMIDCSWDVMKHPQRIHSQNQQDPNVILTPQDSLRDYSSTEPGQVRAARMAWQSLNHLTYRCFGTLNGMIYTFILIKKHIY